MRRIGIFGWVMATGLAVAMFLASVTPAGALCPSGYSCTPPVDVAVQTAGQTSTGIICNTMNGKALNFGSIPLGNGQTPPLRACVCATDAYSNLVDSTGVEFLKANFGGVSQGNFTVVDSGVVINGLQSQINGNTGCDGVILNNTSGCPGNPSQYCYADIQFAPSELGTLSANLTFNPECPDFTNNAECLELLPEPADLLINFVEASPVWLKGIGSGFSIAQPPNGVPIAMSTPASTADPGSVSITFEAQVPSALGNSTVNWMDMLQYSTSGGIKVKTLKDNFTSAANQPVNRDGASASAYIGAGGFWNIMATLGAASDCHSVPVTGTNPPACTIASELKSLYTFQPSGGTPSLLELLAWTESSYQQFALRNLMPPKSTCSLKSMVYGLWPNENSTGGSYVGLMQVDTKANGAAWSWFANANFGSETFGRKLSAAMRNQNQAKNGDTPAPNLLTGIQLENLAAGYYKGFPRTVPYYVLQCPARPTLTRGICTQQWAWVENPNPCKGGGNSCAPQSNVVVQVGKLRDPTVISQVPCLK